MRGVLVAPPTKLLHFKPRLQRLFILVRIIVDAVAGRTFKLDEIVLGHIYASKLR